jgi:hypothetical protein
MNTILLVALGIILGILGTMATDKAREWYANYRMDMNVYRSTVAYLHEKGQWEEFQDWFDGMTDEQQIKANMDWFYGLTDEQQRIAEEQIKADAACAAAEKAVEENGSAYATKHAPTPAKKKRPSRSRPARKTKQVLVDDNMTFPSSSATDDYEPAEARG